MNRNVTPCRCRSRMRSKSRSIAARVELGGRLVEDDEARAERQRPGDLDELPLLDGQVAGERLRRRRPPTSSPAVPAARRAQRPPADQPAAAAVVPVEEEVLGDRQRRG